MGIKSKSQQRYEEERGAYIGDFNKESDNIMKNIPLCQNILVNKAVILRINLTLDQNTDNAQRIHFFLLKSKANPM